MALNSRRCDQHELQEVTDMQGKDSTNASEEVCFELKVEKTKNKHSSAHGHDKKLSERTKAIVEKSTFRQYFIILTPS